MDKYNGDLTQALKWLENNAPQITELVTGYQTWRVTNNDTFWTNWRSAVFNLDTANSFGLMIWCQILGVPSDLVGLVANNYAWAFGEYRKNFIYEDITYGEVTNHNFVDGLFAWANNSIPTVEQDSTKGSVINFPVMKSTSSYGVISQVVEVIPGATLNLVTTNKFSSDAVVDAGNWNYCAIRIYDANAGTFLVAVPFNNSTINTDWVTNTQSVSVPSGITKVKLEIDVRLSTGSMQLSDIALNRPAETAPTYPDKIGGNFYGSPGALTGTEEVRFLLKLRYAALASNGRFIFINRMLNWIVNKGDNMADLDENIVVVDNTALSVANPFTTENYWEYRIGKNVTIGGNAMSAKLIETLNTREYGLAPSIAGVTYKFVQES